MKFFSNLYRRTLRRPSILPMFLGLFLGSLSLKNLQAQSDKDLEDKVFSESSSPSGEALVDEKEAPAPEPEKKSSRAQEREKKYEEAIAGPKEIPREHILVVQNRYVHKEGRHEITPIEFGLQPGDSFRRQIQWGFSYAYHFSESLALEALHVAVITNYNSGLASSILSSTGLETYRAEPVLSLGSAILWSPLHSKAATGDSIYHFEGYFILGGGVTKIENSSVGMFMGGLGFRAFLTKRSLFKMEFRDYVDLSSQVDQRMNVLVGASLLLGGTS